MEGAVPETEQFRLIDVDLHSSEVWSLLGTTLTASLSDSSRPDLHIARVQQVQPPQHLVQRFEEFRAKLTDPAQRDIHFFYHSTHSDNVPNICQQGWLLCKAGSSHGLAYGRGLYFSRSASASLRFGKSTKVIDKDGAIKM